METTAVPYCRRSLSAVVNGGNPLLAALPHQRTARPRPRCLTTALVNPFGVHQSLMGSHCGLGETPRPQWLPYQGREAIRGESSLRQTSRPFTTNYFLFI
ncbi:MAG: hypothetical protein ACHBN1_11715 [Heteroscytonema crispum UTEX LB 1556]